MSPSGPGCRVWRSPNWNVPRCRGRAAFGAGRGATPDLDTDRAAVDVEGGRRLISDREGKTAGQRVPDREADRICGAERRRLGDLARNVIRSERSRRSRIDQGEDNRSSPDCDRAPGERFVKGRERERYRTQQDEREQAWKRDERESTGAPFARLDQRGTSRRARTLRSAASASTPSISASALRTTRCRSVGGTSDFTSSGVTKSRPSSAAAAFAACSKWTPARGLAPSWRSPDRRVSSTMRTM